ncbi:prolipoprotein diacylglyceryl transferase [Candidatus Pacearchaeota archaeon]|nr:prolipoprotein diacylglyceryl transferase [Candidatus Pacearchaeota archaeon]
MYEILLQYGPITITTFNLLLVLAFIVAIVHLVRFIRLKKLKLSFVVEHFSKLILISLIGGRLFYIAEHFSVFTEHPLRMFFLWDLGFSAFGILYAGLATLFYLTQKAHEDFWGWLDVFSLSSFSALFIIHIGHFFNGTHYGSLTNLPWGIQFDTFNIPYTNPIHPTQLYSALATFIIFSISIKSVKRTHLTGVVSSLAIMLYSISALGIDFLHGSPSAYNKTNYLIIAALAFISYVHTSHKKHLGSNHSS